MAYQENVTIATPDALIDIVANFCSAAGWTVLRNQIANGNRRVTLHKPGVTDYVHLYNTDASNVRFRISIGYDGNLGPEAQPLVSGEARTWIGAGAYPKSFLFASQDQVWAVVGIAASGEYRHFTFGRLEKVGAYAGGTYVDGQVWPKSSWWATWTNNSWPLSGRPGADSGFLRVDIPADSKENYYFTIGGNSGASAAFGEVGDSARASLLSQNADDNAFSGRSILHVIPVFVGRTGSALYYSPAGVVQDVRVCSLNKFEPEQEITIASDTWKVFPIVAKRPMNGASGVQPAASGDHGIAIKKVT